MRPLHRSRQRAGGELEAAPLANFAKECKGAPSNDTTGKHIWPKNSRPPSPLTRARASANASMQRSPLTLAERADRHTLYEQAVQCVEAEVDFIDETFKAAPRSHTRGAARRLLRHREHGLRVGPTPPQRTRPSVWTWTSRCWPGAEPTTLPLWARPLTVSPWWQKTSSKSHTLPPDVVIAMNFSYFIFKKRQQMRRYFQACAPGAQQRWHLHSRCLWRL